MRFRLQNNFGTVPRMARGLIPLKQRNIPLLGDHWCSTCHTISCCCRDGTFALHWGESSHSTCRPSPAFHSLFGFFLKAPLQNVVLHVFDLVISRFDMPKHLLIVRQSAPSEVREGEHYFEHPQVRGPTYLSCPTQPRNWETAGSGPSWIFWRSALLNERDAQQGGDSHDPPLQSQLIENR